VSIYLMRRSDLGEKSLLVRRLRLLSFVAQKLSDRKAYALSLRVDLGDLGLNGLSYGEEIGDIVYSLVGNLRNVYKSVDAGDDLSECAEISNRDDLNIDNLSYSIAVLEDLPRIVRLLLIDERNLTG